MRYLKNIFVALLIALPLSNFAQSILNEKSLDKKLKQLQEATQTVGFSVAVVKGNEVIYAKGFGFSDLEKGHKVNENTLFTDDI